MGTTDKNGQVLLLDLAEFGDLKSHYETLIKENKENKENSEDFIYDLSFLNILGKV